MAKTKAVLGKGLNALLSRSETEEIDLKKNELQVDDGRSEMIARIDVDKIRSNPYQPRLDFDETALEELKRSIEQKGVIQPITVRRIDDGFYELISGERRLRAVVDAGIKQIPAYILNITSDREMLELALVENLQREHLNPIEIALSYQKLVNELNYTQDEIAQRIGKDRTTVTNFIRLLKLPSEIQDSVRKGELSMGHARALLSLPDQRSQIKLYKKIIRQGLPVRKVEELVKRMGEPVKSVRLKSVPEGERATHIESKLRQIFGTKVIVHSRPNGGGEITIEFYSHDDFERLLDLIDIIEHYNR